MARLTTIAARVALAPNPKMTFQEVDEFIDNPEYPEDLEPYAGLERFVEESYGNDETFNPSDVKILHTMMVRQWVQAGRPEGQQPMTQQRIRQELQDYGLTYLEQGTAAPPSKQITQAPPRPGQTPADLSSQGLRRRRRITR